MTTGAATPALLLSTKLTKLLPEMVPALETASAAVVLPFTVMLKPCKVTAAGTLRLEVVSATAPLAMKLSLKVILPLLVKAKEPSDWEPVLAVLMAPALLTVKL